MSGSIERAVEKGIKYSSVFAEVSSPMSCERQEVDVLQLNPITKAVFSVASVTFEVCAGFCSMRSRHNVRPFSS